jgi:hypothetical protein
MVYSVQYSSFILREKKAKLQAKPQGFAEQASGEAPRLRRAGFRRSPKASQSRFQAKPQGFAEQASGEAPRLRNLPIDE